MTDHALRALEKAVGRLRDDLEEVERLIADLDDGRERVMADMLDTAAAARAAGVAPSTWKTYVSLGHAPTADATISGRPLWRPETVATWAANRKPKPRRRRG